MTVRDAAIGAGYGAAWRLVRALPERGAYAAFRRGADRAARRNGPGVQRLADNLRVVVGAEMPEDEFAALVREGMRSYAQYWCDAFRLPSMSAAHHKQGLRLDGADRLMAAAATGGGVILALSHSGNWDQAGAWVVANGMRLTTVAERLKPESVYERFLAFRRSLGMEILPLTGGDRPTIDVLTERLQEGAVVPLLADRDFSRAGVQVDFFGRKTRMPGGPAILALRTGAPIFVVNLFYDGRVSAGTMSARLPVPPEDAGSMTERVRAITQAMADEFAAGIAAHPQDWHMLAPMFTRIPAGGRRVPA